ncbi:protein abrupt isoform X2 [Aphidius gifuensis]|uniref:protein abrupt isoform X2 n=1 Tax=Aphidius gifuensis TaxID=684658 RepID=UPI001CDCFCAD|nr:protein abrupt isoform X2 [Aphidius gifuensis]XP_044004152.1 protein abrupt isoform X2 [Aphidius gifuensis]
MAASSSSSSGEQQYSLRWNDFQSSILSSFRHLRDEEDFIDVTLACDSSSFTAHKVVLSACSPYFRRLLKANPCQHPIVILRDVASSDMESLLRFMYHGEVHVGQEQLAAFLKTAQMLQVRGLADVNSSTAGTKDPPTTGSTGRDNGDSPIIPRNLWNDSSRNDPNDSGLSPPPEKRPRSYSPPVGNHLEHKNELQDSLLGQALEGGPTIHTTSNNIQAQSIGEDSNSMSENDEEMSNNDSILNSVKTEPNDLLNDSMEHHRNSFPAALLGLQGLMPGPSGIHAANQDPNYGRWQPSDDAGAWQPGGSSSRNNTGRRIDTMTPEDMPQHLQTTTSSSSSSSSSSRDESSRQQRYDNKQQRLSASQQNQQSQSTTQQQQQQQQQQQHLNSLNPLSLNSEQLTVMHHKLQNNLQSLQVTSSAKYMQSCDPYQQHQNPNMDLTITGKPKCPECGKIYSNNSNLKQHIVNVHTVQTQYISCHVCNKQFKTKQYLQIHLLSMHGIRKRKRYPVYQVQPGDLGEGGSGGGNAQLLGGSAHLSLSQQFGNIDAWSDDKN